MTFRFLCLRHSVEWSGTGQSRPANFSRLATKPVVWRSGKPNRTLIVRHAWIAASL